jgi:xanthine dehydrogenase YagR molybdenum-binding subunit
VGDEIIALAAVSEDTANDAIGKIKVEFEELPHLVVEEDLKQAGDYGKKAGSKTAGDPAGAFTDPDLIVSEGYYGIAAIAHCCLESHGNVAEWTGDKLLTYSSTQNVSGLPGQIGQALREQGVDVADKNIETVCNYIGGGFGSKFSPDEWGIHVAQLAKTTGKPVKLMLDRNMEMEAAGSRPSAYAHDQGGCEEGWHAGRLGFAFVGHRWAHRRGDGSPPVRAGDSQPFLGTHFHQHAHRAGPSVARARPSPGCRAHHVRT